MSYRALSRFYDRLMGDFPYRAYVDYIAPRVGEKALDLACGTGEIALALAKAGLNVHGVDLSQEMLNLAVDKARRAGVTVTFEAGDLRKFAITHYDVVTCASDGLNYVPTKDIKPLMQRVAVCMDGDGRFVFDVSTPYKLREVLGDNVFYEDYDDLTYYWENKWSNRTKSVNMTLTFFEREGETYRRSEDMQKQYAHDMDAIVEACREAGLMVASVVDGDTFGKVRPKSMRWVFCAKKAR